MAVLRNTTYGPDISASDQLAGGLIEPVKAAPGFCVHGAYPMEGGSVVTDICDDAQDHRAFSESAVKPNIPGGARSEVRVIELRNTIGL